MQIATEDAYWARFEARLRDLSVTRESGDVRRCLTDAARQVGEPDASPTDYADLAHRLGIVLGAQVSTGTLDDVRRRNAEDRKRLIAEGVSASLLGRSG